MRLAQFLRDEKTYGDETSHKHTSCHGLSNFSMECWSKSDLVMENVMGNIVIVTKENKYILGFLITTLHVYHNSHVRLICITSIIVAMHINIPVPTGPT